MARQVNPAQAAKMESTPMVPLVLSTSIPLMISLLVQSLYNIVDTMFVSRISETAVSATSLASPIQLLMVAVSVGTGVGINSLLSRTLGAVRSGHKDASEIPAIVTNGLLLAILSSLIFIIFGIFFCVPFLRAFTSDEELLSMGRTYLSICTILCPGIFVATTAERMLQATGKTVLSMCAQVAGAVTNCILDPILIFGYFGLPGMGVAGAAVATVVGQWLAAAVAIILNVTLNHDIHFQFRHFRARMDIIKGIYVVGAPSILVSGLTSIQTMCINKILINYSTTAVAFFGIYHKMQNFVQMPMNGLAQGLIPIVGYSYGQKRGKRVMEAYRVTQTIGLVFMTVMFFIFEIFAAQLLGLFNPGEEMLALGTPAIRILAPSMIALSVISCIGYTFTGMGNGLVNMISSSIRAILPLPFIVLIAGNLGLSYVWYVLPVVDYLACALAVVLFIGACRGKIRNLEP